MSISEQEWCDAGETAESPDGQLEFATRQFRKTVRSAVLTVVLLFLVAIAVAAIL
jgi:hypothetical protein